jgi:hypothetical protein
LRGKAAIYDSECILESHKWLAQPPKYLALRSNRGMPAQWLTFMGSRILEASILIGAI